MVRELLGQSLMACRAGDDQQARRVLVDAMTMPGRVTPPSRSAIAAKMQQGVDQGPVTIARRRMDDQACGLVDDQQMLLVNNRQVDILLLMRRNRVRHRQGEPFVALDFVAGSRTALPSRVSEPALVKNPVLARGGIVAAADEPPARVAGASSAISTSRNPRSLISTELG
jgi:hypothetical protein